jgi:hypothetical protein
MSNTLKGQTEPPIHIPPPERLFGRDGVTPAYYVTHWRPHKLCSYVF